MIKRKINPEYLRRITASNVNDDKIYAQDFQDTVSRFAKEYLAGVMTLKISGSSNGTVKLKLPVVSYLVRLLCEEAEDEPVKCEITLETDKLTLRTTYPAIWDNKKTAYLISIGKLAGFDVKRDSDILFFSTSITVSSIVQIYALSRDEFMDALVTTYNM